MIKTIIALGLCLFCNRIFAQTPGKFTNKHPAGWDSCKINSLFSASSIYYDPATIKIYCSSQLGMAAYKSIPQASSLPYKTIASTTIITFSFKNFSNCLIFLQYKNFQLAAIQKSFKQFKAKYQHAKNEARVNVADYRAFQKKIFYVCK